ncbi:hypothetical protein J7K50_06820 [bacterium]|nr:hypothetical protein [bacterium]
MRYFSIFLLVAVFCCTAISSCGIVDNGEYGYGFPLAHTALLYVESVIIPDEIVEFEPFSIELRVSASRNPKVLHGLTPNQLHWFSYEYGSDLNLKAWITNLDKNLKSSDPPVNIVSFEYDGLSAGTYRLLVETADSLEWGGLILEYDTGCLIPPLHDHAVVREYEIVVLPADDDGGEDGADGGGGES